MRVGQDVSNLLSAILRIDVDNMGPAQPYAVPADNPFVNVEGARPEIWAYGFRNPWKISFDRETGDCGPAMSVGSCGRWFTVSKREATTDGASWKVGSRCT